MRDSLRPYAQVVTIEVMTSPQNFHSDLMQMLDCHEILTTIMFRHDDKQT